MLDRLNDFTGIIRKMNAKRGWNAFLVIFSYWLTRMTGRVIRMGLPYSVSVEPTTSCNLRCPECPSGLRNFKRPTGTMNFEHFKAFIDQVHGHVIYTTLYFQGEPFLNRDFLKIADYARKKRLYTATSTNGHFLDSRNAMKIVELKLDRIIISVDGLDQQTYAQYRVGGKLEKVREGIENLVYWKKQLKSKKPAVIIQFLVMRGNEHHLSEVKSWGKKLGADAVRLKSAQFYDHDQKEEFFPTDPRYKRYKKTDSGDIIIKSKLRNHCFRMWSSCVITWDGRIVPCCFDKDAAHQLGQLNARSFRDIWKGSEYQKFRREVFSNRKNIEICQNCTQGL